MADLTTTAACDLTAAQLGHAILVARERLMVRAARRWKIAGSPPYPRPEDLVQEAIAELLALEALPKCAVAAWLHNKVLQLASNSTRKWKTGERSLYETQLDRPSTPAVSAAGRTVWDQFLGWLRLQAAIDGDAGKEAEMLQVLEAWDADYFGEGDIAEVTGMTVARVRATLKRIERRVEQLPPHLIGAVNADLERTR